MMEISFVLSAFGAGLLASLSPCVYPLLPITVGFLAPRSGERTQRGNVLAFAAGQAVSLAAMGLIAVKFGETLGFTAESPTVRWTVGILLILAGALSLWGRLPAFADQWNSRVQNLIPAGSLNFLGALLLGAGSAVILSPCTSPILGSVLTMIASQTDAMQGAVSMMSYAVGFSSFFLILGLGMMRLPRSGPWLSRIHRLSALLLIAAGIWQIFI